MLAPLGRMNDPTFANANSLSESAGPRGHLPALDALRGLAILAVTAYRFREVPSDGGTLDAIAAKTLNLGDRGVDLFFVLSGFLITGILWDARGQAGYFRNFYIRRGLRIWPLYFGVLVVVLLILPRLLVGTSSALAQPPEDSLWLWLHASNWIMAWEGRWLGRGFDHFWSLAVEEQFYLFWPLAICGLSRRNALWLCGGCVVLAVGLRTWLAIVGWPHPAADVFTLCRLDALAMGAWIALYIRGPHHAVLLQRSIPWLIAVGVGLTLLSMRALRLLPAPFGAIIHDNSFLWTGLACVGILLAALRDHGAIARRFWHHPWLRAAGKYSYGWYVFQGLLQPDFLALGLGDAIAAVTGSAVLGRGGQILLGGGLSLLLAMLSWRFFESRFLALKDRLAPSPARS